MVSFDRQATDFDLRAGLPTEAARQTAAALAQLSPVENGLLLDLGAGTGQLGEHLVGEPCRYLGVDVSAPMLAVFLRKLDLKLGRREHGRPLDIADGALVQADGSARWPIADGKIHLLFLSRAAHLLPPTLLMEEALRVASPEGACVVFGGVRSHPKSLRAILRRQMRRILAEHGIEGRNAKSSQKQLIRSLADQGGEVLPVRTAASWPVVERARDTLAAWRAKAGLGGRAVAPEVQDRVLRRLEDWIRENYGSLNVSRDATESYELAAIQLNT